MTKEELKQEAEKSLDKRLGTYAYIRKQDCYTNYVDGYIDSAEPREKRIAKLEKKVKSLGERCLQLQKDKGNLTDRVKELEAQVEKMRCCGNCEWKAKGVCNGNDTCELKEWKLVETRR